MKARRLDRGSQFALIACLQAVAEAGYDVGAAPEAIGIALGTGSAGAGALTEFLRVLLIESPEAAPPFHFPNTVANAPASQVSIELKIFGPNVTITQKDPSALNALLFSSPRPRAGPREGDARRRRWTSGISSTRWGSTASGHCAAKSEPRGSCRARALSSSCSRKRRARGPGARTPSRA